MLTALLPTTICDEVQVLVCDEGGIDATSEPLSPNQSVVQACFNFEGKARDEAIEQAIDDGADPLVVAYYILEGQERRDAMRKLLDQGAEPDVDFGNYKYPTLLIQAICDNDLELVDLLVQAGADLHMEMPHTSDGALGFALMQDRYEIAQYLIANGSDVNRFNDLGWFLSGSDGYSEVQASVVRAMVLAGAMCDEAHLRYLAQEDIRGHYLYERENYWEDSSPTLLDLIREWRAELRRKDLTKIAEKVRGDELAIEPAQPRTAM